MPADLELDALARLGVAVPEAPPAPGPGEGALDALVRAGLVKRHQAAAARAYVARNAVACACGARGLRGEAGAPARCPACGAALAAGSRGASVDAPAAAGPLAGPPAAAGSQPPPPAAAASPAGAGARPGSGSKAEPRREGPVLAASPFDPGAAPGPGASPGRAMLLRLEPGARVGDLVLEERLGSGASGVVWRARHARLGRPVAVKLVAAGARDDRRRRRFEREVEALARLDHPAIVRVHAAFEVEGALAIEMQLVAGETLAARVARDGPLPWADACRLVEALARAVAHAHAQGVLHRDLKPENVLVRAEDGAPLIADFGLARLTDQASSLTGPGALVGTPVAMAPEAFSGAATPAGDVYGLGVILYFALAGRLPFAAGDGEHVAALWRQIERGRCAPTGAPPPVEAVRARAMATDPGDRHPSAAALADDLARVAAGRAPAAAPRLDAAARRRVRRAAGAAAAALGAVALGVAGARALRRPPPATTERPPAPATPVLAALDLLAGTAAATSSAPGPTAAPPTAAPGAPDEDLRRRALATLLAAIRPGTPEHEALAGGLDGALARAAAPAALRLVRAQRDRARGAPLDPADLAAVASAAPLARAADADALAAHALAAGVRGGLEADAAVDAARALARTFPEARAAADLLGVALAARGDPADRAEAAAALAGVGARSAAAALRIARALRQTEALAAGLDARADVTALGAELAADVAALAAELPRSPALVLAPLEATLRRGFHDGQLIDVVRQEPRRAVARVLLEARAALAPGLLALAELAMELEGDEEEWLPGRRHLPWERLAEAARALEGVDTLLCAAALGSAVHQACGDQHYGRIALPAEALPRLRATLDEVEARLGSLDPALLGRVAAFAEGRGDPAPDQPVAAGLNGPETMFVLWTLHRMNLDRSALDEFLARHLEGAARVAALERAAEGAWRALSASRFAGTSRTHSLGAGVYLRLVDALGRLGEARRAFPWLDERDAVEAEVLRRDGDPEGALAVVARGLAVREGGRTPHEEDLRAVEALALADLGRHAEAERAWRALARLEPEGVCLPGFTSARVADHLRRAQDAAPAPGQ